MFQKVLFFAAFFLMFVNGLLSAQTQQAQTGEAEKKNQSVVTAHRQPTQLLEIGVSANAYRGDLGSYQKWASAFQLGLKFNRKKRLNGHLNVAIGTLTGQNPAYVFTGESESVPSPNRFFKTNFVTVNYDLQVNFIKTPRWMVYVSQGVGLIRYNPKDDRNVSLRDQLSSRPSGEAYGTVALLFPTQVGAMYLFPNGYGAGIQSGFLNTTTDYLDNISQWGNRRRNDNALWVKFQFVAPLKFD